MLVAVAALALSLCVRPGLGALYNSTSELPAGRPYDYIIVGAGTAGSILGRRLSENPARNVLLIEAGSNPDFNILTQVPFFTFMNWHGAADWNYTTAPQLNANGRSTIYPIGKVLGGATSIGLELYDRGGRDDYDIWGRITGDPNWTGDKLFPYMLKIEHPSTTPDSNLTGKWIPSVHGTDGPFPLAVYSATKEFPTDPLIIEATQELPDEFPWNPDLSSGNSIGIGWVTVTAENGTRATTWTHYLRPVIERTNLDVVINTQVTKVLQTGWQNGKPAFQGVEFAANATSPRGTLKATREVILSAGAVLTPQLLMLSGIGDNATLTSLGIPTIVNNSNVGLNLQEHHRLSALYMLEPGTPTLDIYRQNTTAAHDGFEFWEATHTGPYTIVGPKQMGFFRNPTDVAPFNTSDIDPSAGPTSGHYQLAFGTQYSSFVDPKEPPTGSYLTIIVNVVSPASYGNITLRSASPFDAPIIDPGLYASYYDVATMREGIKAANRLAQSKALSNNFIVSPIEGLGAVIANGTDAAFEAYARNYTTPTFQPTGTARMVSVNGTDGVLDSKLNVLGTVGLRVVDASSLPHTPSSFAMAPVMIMVERAADIIKGDAVN